MYNIEIESVGSFVSLKEENYSNALHWAESIALAEQNKYGRIKNIDIFHQNKLVASLRTIR